MREDSELEAMNTNLREADGDLLSRPSSGAIRAESGSAIKNPTILE
jgi:hypothetical protein